MVWCGVMKVRSGDAKGNALNIFILCFLGHVEQITKVIIRIITRMKVTLDFLLSDNYTFNRAGGVISGILQII